MALRNCWNCVVLILQLGFLKPKLRIPFLMLLGLFCGMGILLAHIARMPSYLADSPNTCMNCHVMTDAYVSHRQSSHGRNITCNDCHVPHTSINREYLFKAHDGLRHASVFTMRTEPQAMTLSKMAIPVVQENCIRCHEERVSETSAGHDVQNNRRCWDCHREVPHGKVRSLSASPNISRPRLPPVTEFPTVK